MHASTAGLKSMTTTATADGIEECRKLCGGHGYLCSSGLPELFAVYVPVCTFEGDNVVLLLQVARFLMKTVSQLGSGNNPAGSIAYMGKIEHLMQCRSDVEQAEDWLKPSAILDAFEARAARMSVACAQNLSKFNLIIKKKLRPNAVSLVDAFNHTNHFLGSILGRYDGNVYPKLYEAAWKDPLNESNVPDGFNEYIRPLLKPQLQTARL